MGLPSLREIQHRSLKLLEVARQICVDNDIKYSLNGGTVVGAHLYKGILPWDDDVDIMMTRDNFEQFLKVAPRYCQRMWNS